MSDEPHATPPAPIPPRAGSPLSDPRALASSLVLHGLLLLLASSFVIGVGSTGPDESGRLLRADLQPVDNRVVDAPEGGGAPGPLGGAGPAASAVERPDRREEGVLDPALASLLRPDIAAPVDSDRALLSLGNPDTRGLGLVPGPGLGGGGGSGGGSGGGIGPGFGPVTEFFGAREQARSFAYVIDRSGSMTGHHALDLAKREFLASIDRLPPDAQFAVLFYNLEPALIRMGPGGLAPATAANKQTVRDRLDSVRADGGTDHVAALRAALKLNAQVIFFLTDAQQLTTSRIDQLAGEMGATRLQVILFGVGPDPRTPDPLKTLALQSGGSFHYIDVLSHPRGSSDDP